MFTGSIFKWVKYMGISVHTFAVKSCTCLLNLCKFGFILLDIGLFNYIRSLRRFFRHWLRKLLHGTIEN